MKKWELTMKIKERREKAKAFVNNNKLFVVIGICLSIYLISFFIKKDDTEVIKTADTVVTEEQEESDKIEWRFYWSDFIVLVGGSAFCGYKIIQRNRKAKEEI